MRHVGQEGALGAIRLFGRIFRQAQLFLRSLALGDITDDALEPQNAAVLGPPGRRSEEAVHLCPVLPPQLCLKVFYSTIVLEFLSKPDPVSRINIVLPDVYLHDLVPGITKEVQESLVDVNCLPLWCINNDGVLALLEQGTILRLALP